MMNDISGDPEYLSYHFGNKRIRQKKVKAVLYIGYIIIMFNGRQCIIIDIIYTIRSTLYICQKGLSTYLNVIKITGLCKPVYMSDY